jgi:hypothetical protein
VAKQYVLTQRDFDCMFSELELIKLREPDQFVKLEDHELYKKQRDDIFRTFNYVVRKWLCDK